MCVLDSQPVLAVRIRVCSAIDEGHRLGGNAFLAAGEAEAFGGGCLHRYAVGIYVEIVGDGLYHLRNVGEEFRSLGNDGQIHVADAVAFFGYDLDHSSEKPPGVGTFVGGIGVGEVIADVAHGGSAKEGVGEGVEGYVGIAVAE